MTRPVIGIYAFCDVDPAASPSGRFDFTVTEFAELSDGQTVLLRETGWSSTPSAGGPLDLSEEILLENVRAVVLPDDAETSNDGHPWQQFVTALVAKGVPVTADELRDVPYTIRLAPGLPGPARRDHNY
ncbi:hypothetical protein ACFYY8_26975 [Streptosporangium sp. NPDC001559]|uniref:hypothetical protein n=1 Tax=Streptosporangium sp. NPDC001559 TaxID=3366187 RepID=UPI0036E46370